ncbi:podoplanin isoform X2 [Plectropomus leopardus]|uniref:podoplanin isoform X2 n=1 Tax=Plectropomus leopardus TaxID=160734 RepID=UPI001C4AF4F2|nr:podoplanin isoform X2 [Plectropomus leopardus]
MNVQLLLLLALAGPFCAFTHASPTGIPEDLAEVPVTSTPAAVPEATEAPQEELIVITGPTATEPVSAHKEVDVVTEAEVSTEAVTPTITFNTEAAVVETETPPAATEGQELITDPPALQTAAPTEPKEAEAPAEATAAAKTETDDGVIVEDPDEGLSSGQVVGIVIGALLAVVIVIAVVIAVVRRMGKYSP